MFADGVARIDDGLAPLAGGRIPIVDQGFLRSDLTYDVPAVRDGRFFRLDDHIDWLEASCAKMRSRHRAKGIESFRGGAIYVFVVGVSSSSIPASRPWRQKR